ncbi:hypothetical protein BU15DRAFT_78475 [Melanogaster broomeanus]|nr:hypothetical protein BU15DRAFT_78475 [Melanogaster broomeanus]
MSVNSGTYAGYGQTASDDQAQTLHFRADSDDTPLHTFPLEADFPSTVTGKPVTSKAFRLSFILLWPAFQTIGAFEATPTHTHHGATLPMRTHLRIHARADGNVASSDEFGPFDADGESEGTDESDLASAFSNGIEGLSNMDLCEVEVTGHVHDITGDEEGLIAASGFMPTPNFNNDASNPNARQLDASDTSWVSLSHSPAPSDSMLSYNGEAIMASLSAPSYKLDFDSVSHRQSAMTPGNVGPVRRHRSTTPSLTRSIDRGQSMPPAHGYHPYALLSASHSRSGSNQSSPSSLAHPLDISATPGMSLNDHMYITQPRCFSSALPTSLGLERDLDSVFSTSMPLYDGRFDLSPPYSAQPI